MQLSESNVSRLSLLARKYLGDSSGAFVPQASRSVRLRRAKPCEAASSSSRLGGAALLPAGHRWPVTDAGQPLSFIGQINTGEISVPASCPPLPQDTLLAFFYEAEGQRGWGFDPADRQYWKVVAVPRAMAVPVDPPEGAAQFVPHHVVPEQVTTIPDQSEEAIRELWDASSDAIGGLYGELDGGDAGPRHRMFGWPDLVQNSMQLECQLASNGIYVGGAAGYRDPRVQELKSGAAEWMLLLQVDTDDEVGWMWGDVGTIYYWIRRSDLASGRFDCIWMIFQCC